MFISGGVLLWLFLAKIVAIIDTLQIYIQFDQMLLVFINSDIS
jgi:hypothetical protein